MIPTWLRDNFLFEFISKPSIRVAPTPSKIVPKVSRVSPLIPKVAPKVAPKVSRVSPVILPKVAPKVSKVSPVIPKVAPKVSRVSPVPPISKVAPVTNKVSSAILVAQKQKVPKVSPVENKPKRTKRKLDNGKIVLKLRKNVLSAKFLFLEKEISGIIGDEETELFDFSHFIHRQTHESSIVFFLGEFIIPLNKKIACFKRQDEFACKIGEKKYIIHFKEKCLGKRKKSPFKGNNGKKKQKIDLGNSNDGESQDLGKSNDGESQDLGNSNDGESQDLSDDESHELLGENENEEEEEDENEEDWNDFFDLERICDDEIEFLTSTGKFQEGQKEEFSDKEIELAGEYSKLQEKWMDKAKKWEKFSKTFDKKKLVNKNGKTLKNKCLPYIPEDIDTKYGKNISTGCLIETTKLLTDYLQSITKNAAIYAQHSGKIDISDSDIALGVELYEKQKNTFCYYGEPRKLFFKQEKQSENEIKFNNQNNLYLSCNDYRRLFLKSQSEYVHDENDVINMGNDCFQKVEKILKHFIRDVLEETSKSVGDKEISKDHVFEAIQSLAKKKKI